MLPSLFFSTIFFFSPLSHGPPGYRRVDVENVRSFAGFPSYTKSSSLSLLASRRNATCIEDTPLDDALVLAAL